MKTLIKNATLLDMVGNEPNIRKTDILIEENKIVKIEENIDETKAEIIDAKEKVVMPGFVNTHTHLAMSIFRGYKDDQKLMDWLENAIFPVEDKLRPDDIYWNSFLSCIELIKTGTTTFNDMYFRMDKTIEAVEESGLRGVIAWSITDTSIKDKITRTREYHEKYNHENSRIKVYVSAHAPYSCSPDTIQLCVDLAKELDTGIHIHLSETLQEDKLIKKKYNKTGTEYLNDLHVFDVPVVLAHGIYISDSDLEILKNIKGGISHNPISNCKLSSGICNVGKLRKNGINVGLGTDGIGSTTTLDMFEEMKTAAYLQKVNTMDPTAIKAYDLLKMATIEGARVLGLEDEIGTIEVGKKADMIFINTNKTHLYPENDLCTNLVYSANGADVDTVMVDGKILMQNRKLLNINEKHVKKNIAKVVKRLL
ncbi:MAG: amidohydrolase [Clostridia bacterium]|jgi:5-methylthioadenosine/S-adenosylhomocysteine deaminase|nr:amidohydrolase [Clostridia bacterium]